MTQSDSEILDNREDDLLIFTNSHCQISWLKSHSFVFVVVKNRQLRILSVLFHIKVSELFVFLRCCQNGLVSVWTVPQEVSKFPESCSSTSDGWWDTESKSKFMVIQALISTQLNLSYWHFYSVYFKCDYCNQLLRMSHSLLVFYVKRHDNVVPVCCPQRVKRLKARYGYC